MTDKEQRRIFVNLKNIAELTAEDPTDTVAINRQIDKMHRFIHRDYAVKSCHELTSEQLEHLFWRLHRKIKALTEERLPPQRPI